MAGVIYMQHPLMIVYAYTHLNTKLDSKDRVILWYYACARNC